MSDPELERIRRNKFKQLMEGRRYLSSASREEGLTQLETKNFHQIVDSSRVPVVVDFWAAWCMPCRIMHPIFERLSKKYADRAIFARLNVDENPEIASEYSVYSIPTFIIFVGGKPVEQVVGAVGEKALERAVAKHI